MDDEGVGPRVRLTVGQPAQGPGGVRLVVGYDRQPVSRRALDVAADLGGRLGAELHVVHAIDLTDYPIDPERADWDALASDALADEHRAVADALAGTATGWTYHAARGNPVRLLTHVADEQDALMIVVGSRGHTTADVLTRLLEGSVTHGLTGRRQHRPVLLVP
jgi:nucleotide-binding universal stress UspA family protein